MVILLQRKRGEKKQRKKNEKIDGGNHDRLPNGMDHQREEIGERNRAVTAARSEERERGTTQCQKRYEAGINNKQGLWRVDMKEKKTKEQAMRL